MIDFAGIIFDMDGLLVDSEPIWEIAEIQLIESYGNVYDPAYREAIIGLRMDEFLAVLNQYYDFKGRTIERLHAQITEYMRELIPQKAVPKPGAHEIIAFVHHHKIPCAIASSSPLAVIESVLQSQGWSAFIPTRFSAEHVEKGKPAPDVYLAAARHLGIAPEECLALEDSPNGSRAAVSAGMTCYAVPDLFHSSPDAFGDITPHIFNDLHEVLNKLKKQGERN